MRGLGGNPKREQPEDKNPKNIFLKGFLCSGCSRLGFTPRPLIWLLGRRSPDANLVVQTVTVTYIITDYIVLGVFSLHFAFLNFWPGLDLFEFT